MKGLIKKEAEKIFAEFRKLDRKTTLILLSIPLLITISWYYTSRRFYNLNLYHYFKEYEVSELIEFYYWYLGDLITLFLLPVLLIKFLFKESLTGYGLKAGEVRPGAAISISLIIIMLPLIWVVSSYSSFSNTYPLLNSARESWKLFVFYQAGLIMYIFAWEFIWRGYMLFGLKEKFGYYAVFIQTIPFVILHNGKPAVETFGAIAAGIMLGLLALRTGSIYYGVIIHSAVMINMDLVSVLRYKSGEYGTGINSLLKIFNNQ